MGNSRWRSFNAYYKEEGIAKTIHLLTKIFLLKVGILRKINFGRNKDLHFRPGSSDLPVFRQIFVDKQYDFPVRFEPKIIFDLGANVGFASIYFSNKFPQAKIIALEPEIANYHQLVKNAALHPNIELLQAAVWSNSGELDIAVNSTYGEWGASMFIEGKSSKVKSVTIPELMDRFHVSCIDILKIDIEGSEKEIFSACNEWIEKVKVTVIELHDHLVPGCTDSFMNAIRHLKNYSLEQKGESFILRNLNLIN
ncbi:MAG TPA: FkbM family methyltransferase [Chitinophagales bacterium]|nr:FkbM family methyltransferase [Chitinophagales bacterium]